MSEGTVTSSLKKQGNTEANDIGAVNHTKRPRSHMAVFVGETAVPGIEWRAAEAAGPPLPVR